MDGETSPEAARRLAWIQDVGGGAPLPLTIVLGTPRRISDDEYRADGAVSCVHFEKNVYAVGLDGLQSLTGLILLVYGLLLGLQRQGYAVFWLEPGDLERAPLWGINQA